jgi:transposase
MKPKLKVKEKLMLLELAAYGKNVSAACEYMGVSRKTYYQIKKAYDEGGVKALASKNRRVPNLKNRIPDYIKKAVLRLSKGSPALGKKKASQILKNQGLQISPNGVMAVWKRHGLEAVIDKIEGPESAFRKDTQ